MIEIPSEILERRDAYCESRGLEILDMRGSGLDGFVWQTTRDSILKVFRRESGFYRELAIYQRLEARAIVCLGGFHVPQLLYYDEILNVLELSFVRPPYILDFASATLDQPSPDFDPDSPDWIAEHQRQFGRRWNDVVQLLDALRQFGIYYSDAHPDNIRIQR